MARLRARAFTVRPAWEGSRRLGYHSAAESAAIDLLDFAIRSREATTQAGQLRRMIERIERMRLGPQSIPKSAPVPPGAAPGTPP